MNSKILFFCVTAMLFTSAVSQRTIFCNERTTCPTGTACIRGFLGIRTCQTTTTTSTTQASEMSSTSGPSEMASTTGPSEMSPSGPETDATSPATPTRPGVEIVTEIPMGM